MAHLANGSPNDDGTGSARFSTSHPEQLVFRSPAGLPIRATLFRRRFWTPAVKSAELDPMRIHGLRHNAVSLWIAERAHPKQVATLAGQTSVSVVLDRYGHVYPHQDEQLVNALDRRVERALARRR